MSDSSPGFAAVITTIQEPTSCVLSLLKAIQGTGAGLIVIGDQKGPRTFEAPDSELFSLDDQLGLPFKLPSLLPVGHYARKNIGYLVAMSRGAAFLYETDDDNEPNERWQLRSLQTEAQPLSSRPWANVYRLYSSDLIWPRGFPLRLVTDLET